VGGVPGERGVAARGAGGGCGGGSGGGDGGGKTGGGGGGRPGSIDTRRRTACVQGERTSMAGPWRGFWPWVVVAFCDGGGGCGVYAATAAAIVAVAVEA